MSFFEKPIIKFAACVILAALIWMMDGLFDVPSQTWHLSAVLLAVIAMVENSWVVGNHGKILVRPLIVNSSNKNDMSVYWLQP